ncbi:hypothetical protein JQC91_02715 [Jannaschia sp. Os4]|uniref:hypothetical protein n=1 Tax=Jannaschia sp. Os4 TaxID=2807617 RepID=UPI0019392ADE|nr:hypothetical protein [Jannaschia sp. Os4]MBM2575207.1 hypothetical protein [Jannaschia sp. Os4]
MPSLDPFRAVSRPVDASGRRPVPAVTLFRKIVGPVGDPSRGATYLTLTTATLDGA